jgi:hypothetical protein
MTVALRRVAYYWPEAHAKLLSMPWEWSDKIPFGATDGDRLFFNRTDDIYLDESFSDHKSVEQIYRELILAKEKNAAIVGTVQKVLCEGPSKHNPSTLSGRTPQNKIVIFEGDVNKLTGEILDVKVKESTGFTTIP